MAVPRAIKLVLASWDQLAALLENDLRRGICRVRLPKLPAIGSAVKIDLGLPSGSSVAIGGQVKRHATELDDPVRGQGVEVVITSFPPESLWLIESSLKAARDPRPQTVERLDAGAMGPDTLDPLSKLDTGDLSRVPPPADTWNDQAAREFDPLPTDQTDAPTGATLVQALRGEKLALESMNPFEQLGARFDASDDEVREAFQKASRRYTPDQIARYDSDEAKALAGEIYMILRDAYRKIGDAASRHTTLRGVRGLTPRALGSDATPAPGADLMTPEKVLSFRPSTGATPPPAIIDDEERTTPEGLTHDALFGDLTLPPDQPPPGDRGLLPGMLDAPQPELVRANALLDAGHVDEALQLFDEALKNRPRDREARAGKELAFGYRSLTSGDRLAAARHFENALQMIPANERAARALDLTRRSQGQSGKAILDRILGKK